MSGRRKSPDTVDTTTARLTHRVAVLRVTVEAYVASGRATEFESAMVVAELDEIAFELDQMLAGSKGARS